MSTNELRKKKLGQLVSTAVFMIVVGVIAFLVLTDSSGIVSDANLVRGAVTMPFLAAMVLIVVDDFVRPRSGQRPSWRSKNRQT